MFKYEGEGFSPQSPPESASVRERAETSQAVQGYG